MIAAYRTIAGNRNLVRLFTGEFVSGIGDWLYLVALLVVVYRESSDPFLLGLIVPAARCPASSDSSNPVSQRMTASSSSRVRPFRSTLAR